MLSPTTDTLAYSGTCGPCRFPESRLGLCLSLSGPLSHEFPATVTCLDGSAAALQGPESLRMTLSVVKA